MNEANPIIDEIRETRENMLARHGGDIDLLIDELQKLSADRDRVARAAVSSDDSGEPLPVGSRKAS